MRMALALARERKKSRCIMLAAVALSTIKSIPLAETIGIAAAVEYTGRIRGVLVEMVVTVMAG